MTDNRDERLAYIVNALERAEMYANYAVPPASMDIKAAIFNLTLAIKAVSEAAAATAINMQELRDALAE